MAYTPKGGSVPVHPSFLIFRSLQPFFALLIIATTAYALSIRGGGSLQPPLISTLLIAILTILPILLLTTPLHLSQRRFYDPRAALLLDIFTALFWLATFAALASYHDIFSGYGRNADIFRFDGCRKCRRAWRSGVAATVFAAVEFLLFLGTGLAFAYYYHYHLTGKRGFGIAERKTEEGALGAAGGAEGGVPAEEHHLQSRPAHSHTGHGADTMTPPDVPAIPHPPATHHGTGGTSDAFTSHPLGGSTRNGPMSNYGSAPNKVGGPPYPQSPVRPSRPGGYGEFGTGG